MNSRKINPERQAELEKHAANVASAIENERRQDVGLLIHGLARVVLGHDPEIDITALDASSQTEVLTVMRAARDTLFPQPVTER